MMILGAGKSSSVSGRRAPAVLAGLALLTTLAGCSGGPEIRYYSLLLAGEGVPAMAGSPAGKVVHVAPFRIEAPYAQDRLVYRRSPASPEVGFYHYHRWAQPLAEQLAELTATSLAEDFPGLVFSTWRSSEESTPSIRGRLVELAEVGVEGGVEVRVRLEITLLDSEGRRLTRETLESRADGTPESVGLLVPLMRSALDRCLASSSALRQVRPLVWEPLLRPCR